MQEQSIHSRTYRLLGPYQMEEVTVNRTINEGEVVVEPLIASICHADLRYFMGQRKPEVLTKKLPMALLHEGIGRVVESKSNSVSVGDRVVIVPNIPGHLLKKGHPEECSSYSQQEFIANYGEKNVFLGSGYDGIAQNRLVLPAECAIPIPDSLPNEIAVLSELCTVSYHALSRVKQKLESSQNTTVAVFGDGPVGYLTAAMIHHVYNLGPERLTVFGAIDEKLKQFTFASRKLVQNYDFKSSKKVDIIVECTGGAFSEHAINQGIDLAARGGTIILMGVSEDRVPINTRDVLEKGLSLYGSSRSSSADYHAVMKAMENIEYQKTLRAILPKSNTPIHNLSDFQTAMKSASEHRHWEKIILDFDWSAS
ncbi:alcohol dehydrogenase catalytic domain-containing protein [Fictibacillus phosphorivorans]|nr:alcohol dehydrogenase catalytic domain-containing protein [Fictibacillus phosphorivorans]